MLAYFLAQMREMLAMPAFGAAAGGVTMGFAFFFLGFAGAMLVCCLLQPAGVTADG
jgi:hypothetical protein